MSQVVAVDEEFIFEGNAIISQTDLKGVITYANRKFCEVSGYSVDELVGKPHNIIRHPDMPHALFEKMWDSLSSAHTWNGLIKNLRKDGRYYWTDTEILPIINEDDELTGYIASRRSSSKKDIQETKVTYAKMYEDEQQG
jgi:aerotaxis receptor